MTSEKFRQLTDVHVQHLIWRNELELALIELDFWEKLVRTLDEKRQGIITGEDWREEIGRLHYFQRLIQQLLLELNTLNKEVAEGVQLNQVLRPEVRASHQYLRQQMDSFHNDFLHFKNEMRHFVVAQPEF